MKLKAAFVAGIACAILAIPLFASSDAVPAINVPLINKPPVMDGKIDSSEWAGAAVIPEFGDYATGKANLAHQTTCRVERGRDALYIAFECKDNDTGKLLKNVTQRDGPVFLDDCVEVFLSTTSDAKTYYQFCVNVSGARYDGCGWDGIWDGYWVGRTSIGKDAWYAELKIPYSTLGIKFGSKSAGTWRANFCRDYPARSGANGETSCWSPTVKGFHIPERFGTLNGMALDSRYLVVSPDAGLKAPERWLIGRNNVELSLKNLSGSPVTAQVACVDPETGAIIDKHAARVAASTEAKLNVPLELPKSGDYTRQYVVFDSAGSVISTSPVLHARASILNCSLLSPAFRGSIQSKDPSKQILVQGAIGIAGKQKWKVLAIIRPAGKRPIWGESIEPGSGRVFEIKRDASDLPAGEYDLDILLEDANGKNVASQSYPIKVLAPASEEVTFDKNRICYVNGKPLFPIGLYQVHQVSVDQLNDRAKQIGLPMLDLDSVIKDISDHGFNTILTNASMDPIRAAKDAGLWMVPGIDCPSVAEFAKYRKTADDFGNVLFWYGFDEPVGERLRSAIDAHQQYLREDPHRPFSGAICYPSVFDSAAQTFDVLMMDPYFVGTAPLSTIGEWVDRGMSATNGTMPIWVIPQAFAIDDCWCSEPTPAQLRCQAYISIVHGATGLVWYAYYTAEKWSKNQKGRNQWCIADTPLWPYFKILNAEVNNLAPVITSGKNLGRLAWSDRSIHSAQWEYNGSRYIIAVNTVDEPIPASIGCAPGKSADVLSENRRIGIQGGKLSDTFGPLEVHIYKCIGK